MNRQTFKKAYHAARIGQINENTLESIAAIIALQDARKPDLIGRVYRDAVLEMEVISGCKHFFAAGSLIIKNGAKASCRLWCTRWTSGY